MQFDANWSDELRVLQQVLISIQPVMVHPCVHKACFVFTAAVSTAVWSNQMVDRAEGAEIDLLDANVTELTMAGI